MDWILGGLGLVLLLLAGDALVKGAVNLSLRLGIPALIVGLTIVAFGTSAPEMLVSVKAVLDDAPGIALGNVVGSNIANILLVLGLPAVVAGLSTSKCEVGRDYAAMLAVSVAFAVLCIFGPLTWVSSLILLAILAVILFFQMQAARAHRSSCATDEIEGADPDLPWSRILVFLAIGLVGLPLGAQLLVSSATNIARTFGISETVIGLTIIALGTSLPELATTLMAALRGKADVALGNVVGSNVFNLLAIIGVAGLFGNIPVDPEFLRLDLWVMLGSSLLLAPFVLLRWDMGRGTGIGLTGLYLAYMAYLLV